MGLNTVCIEKRGSLGGTCLNVGCIPSKALLNISHKYHELNHDFAKMGIEVPTSNLNWGKVQQTKNDIVTSLTKGIEGLFKKNKVSYMKGLGSFVDQHTMYDNLIILVKLLTMKERNNKSQLKISSLQLVVMLVPSQVLILMRKLLSLQLELCHFQRYQRI